MSKRIALLDFVEVDSIDLSNLSRQVRFSSEHAEQDVSGFNEDGNSEYLPGATTQQVNVEFYGSYGTGEVHETIYHVHKDRSVVPFKWRPDSNTPASATNPELRGNVAIYTYAPGATRGDVDAFEVVFRAADAAGLEFFDAPAIP